MNGIDSPVLQTAHLVIEWDNKRILDGLDLSIPASCIYALLGGNGAGKTTTLNALLGFIRPTTKTNEPLAGMRKPVLLAACSLSLGAC